MLNSLNWRGKTLATSKKTKKKDKKKQQNNSNRTNQCNVDSQ